jgi:hypothetical protein
MRQKTETKQAGIKVTLKNIKLNYKGLINKSMNMIWNSGTTTTKPFSPKHVGVG